MKKLIYYSLMLFTISACQNREEKTPSIDVPAKMADPVEKNVVALPYTAEYNEQTQKITLSHVATDDLSDVSPKEMIEALNNKYPNIQLELLSTDHNLAHVKIADARYLTENMGTTGAKTYLAEATYALTEISGIKGVDFVFSEGDHASPGVYTRDDFKDL